MFLLHDLDLLYVTFPMSGFMSISIVRLSYINYNDVVVSMDLIIKCNDLIVSIY